MKLLLVFLAAMRLVAAGDFALDFLPANTKVVFGIHVPAIAGSALFKDAGTGALKVSEEWLKLLAIAGFDPLHDIDEILLASPADNEKAAALLVLRGRFDLARMGAGAARYRRHAGSACRHRPARKRRANGCPVSGARPIAARALRRVGHGRAQRGLRGAHR
ncbi:MAG: hypothetical protein NTW28_19385 [Candidatus Solibacter sp.]|nr:hypothetical protein [Candidatus Solibacter sp.]